MGIPTGAIRYNTDSNKMEYFDGTKWWQVAVSSPDLSAGTTEPGTRGVFAGSGPSPATTMDWITISTLGDATDFANNDTSINYSRQGSSRIRGFIGNDVAGCSNQTRLLIGGGKTPSFVDTIQYLTIASTGDAKDFGNLT